jgi:hypothetical protein
VFFWFFDVFPSAFAYQPSFTFFALLMRHRLELSLLKYRPA